MQFSSLIVFSLCMVQVSLAQEFRVQGTQLLDPNGKEFIIRGVNSNHADWDSHNRHYGRNSLNAIARTGANTVRIVWKVKGNTLTLNDLKNIIEEAKKHKMISVVEYHDATGSPDPNALMEAANWWNKAIKEVLNNYRRYVIINLANEWSPFGTPSKKWFDAYRPAVAKVRESGWAGAIIIDASAYAQNTESILDYGKQLLDSDPKKNLLFSLHMYAEWKKTGGRNIGAGIKSVKDKGLALLIGEFTLHHPEGCKWIEIDAWEIMRQAQTQKVGWLAWSWHGNGKGDCNYDLDMPDKSLNMVKDKADQGHTWTKQDYTKFGEIVTGYKGYSLQDTSKRASVFA